MERFPQSVRSAMQRSGAAATCLSVSLTDDHTSQNPHQNPHQNPKWESAIFFQLAGAESKEDRRLLRKSSDAVSVGIETDLITHDSAGIVVLRLEVYTRDDDPLVGEVLFAPGEHKSHFETLDLLTRQPRLIWFFGDESFHVLKQQQFLLSDEEHKAFSEILSDTLRHDALLRMTTGYDAAKAMNEVVSRYEMRQTTEQSNYQPQSHSQNRPKN